jgi:hypothetical protein
MYAHWLSLRETSPFGHHGLGFAEKRRAHTPIRAPGLMVNRGAKDRAVSADDEHILLVDFVLESHRCRMPFTRPAKTQRPKRSARPIREWLTQVQTHPIKKKNEVCPPKGG